MSKRLFFAAIFITVICGTTSLAQVYSPEKGSAERKVILDAVRIPVEKELKQKIIFVVDNLKVQGNWAFVSGQPQSADGGPPNYNGTPYQEAVDGGAFDNNFFALLKKTGGKWKVIKRAIGCTDVCYLTWAKDYRAPKAIFPYTE